MVSKEQSEVIDPELLAQYELLRLYAHKSVLNVQDYKMSFIAAGESVESQEHHVCGLLAAVNSRGKTLITHAYPPRGAGHVFAKGPRIFLNHFSDIYWPLCHLFHPEFALPLALCVVSEVDEHQKHWRFFEEAVATAFPDGKEDSELVEEYFQWGINLCRLKEYLDRIVYVDLEGNIKPYNVRATRTVSGLDIATIGHGEHDVAVHVELR